MATNMMTSAGQIAALEKMDPVGEGLSLSKQLNPLYIQNFQQAMEAVAPGSGKAVADNIGALLSGQIPADVLEQLKQSTAEMNLSQGRFGEIANFTAARNIGKTSLDMTQLGLQDLKSMMPNLPDIDTLIQQARGYDLSKIGAEIQVGQTAAALAQRQKEFAQSTALEKMRLALSANQQAFAQGQAASGIAEQGREFDANLAWEKELSGFNRTYEKWAAGQKQQLANSLIAAGSAASKAQSDAFSQALAGTFAQGTAVTPSAVSSPATATPMVVTNPVTPTGTGMITYGGQTFTTPEFFDYLDQTKKSGFEITDTESPVSPIDQGE